MPLLLLAAAIGTSPLTPMNAGFHEELRCRPGYVTVDVAPADPAFAPGAMVVTTAVAVGPMLIRTRAVRRLTGGGAIEELGYMIDGPAFRRFPAEQLLPAAPPPRGWKGAYHSLAGGSVEKRYDGPRPGGGFAFSDFAGGRRLNTAVYAPGIGLTAVRFFGLNGAGGDVVCALRG